jgi:SUN domain-containing protein 1/2
VTALHHELHNGHCWPFAGQEGQLGVVLAAPILVEEVTIDHLAREIAYDVRSAPRQMEVWGMVEGKDNIERLKVWKEARQSTDGAHVDVGDVIYPKTLPKVPEYVRLANFTYDIHTADHVQTFNVDPEIRSLGVDFGVVVLRVLNNWGVDEFTCLYRFRVHGQKLGGVPVPYGGVVDEEQSS